MDKVANDLFTVTITNVQFMYGLLWVTIGYLAALLNRLHIKMRLISTKEEDAIGSFLFGSLVFIAGPIGLVIVACVIVYNHFFPTKPIVPELTDKELNVPPYLVKNVFFGMENNEVRLIHELENSILMIQRPGYNGEAKYYRIKKEELESLTANFTLHIYKK